MLHRGQESTDGAGNGELTVPMAWFYAEYIADELLRTGDLMPPTSFEFRAGRDALALTIYLSDTEGELSGIQVVTQLETWLSLTAYDQPWQDWVRERTAALAAAAVTSGGPSPTWNWPRRPGAGYRRPSCSPPIWTRSRGAARWSARTTDRRCGRPPGSSGCLSDTSPSISSRFVSPHTNPRPGPLRIPRLRFGTYLE